MIEWNYIVAGLSLLLLSVLLWQEVRRVNKARLVWRVLATIFAVGSLAGIALPITYHHTEDVANNHEAVLLTEGFDRDSLNKFLSVNNNNIQVLRTQQNLKDAGKYNGSYVPDVSSFAGRHNEISTFHVFGYGLQKDELAGLKNVSLVFHPTELATGISSINWNRKIKTGERFLIQGRINNASSNKVRVVLKSFNSPLDSINVATRKNQNFQLTTIPKHAGRTIYTLTVFANRDTVEKELVPVQVEQGEPLKVLMLASSPDFENKFLKNYLSQMGYEVIVRTAISKNKFVKDFINASSLPINRITSSLLDKFDITIADAGELNSISASELTAIQNQVSQKSMGLIIKADSASLKSSFYAARFPLVAVADSNQLKMNTFLSDTTNRLPAIYVENLLLIRNQPGTQPIVIDKNNRIFANSTLYGSGKIILTTLTNTYSWMLSGKQNDYDKFWTELLNKATAKHSSDEAWTVGPSFPEINKRVQLRVQTNNSGIPQGQVGESSVYLKEEVNLPYQWTGTYYPNKEGWQTGIQLNGNRFYWYAYNHNEWKNIRAKKTIEATKEYITNNNFILKTDEREVKVVETELPKWLFFLLFLLFSGFLWFENKT